MIDLDDFKRVNDTYGHQQGDEVLAQVAWVLRDASRDLDTVARYGGEELAVVLPQTDCSGAAAAGRADAARDRGPPASRAWAAAARSRSRRASEWPRCQRTAADRNELIAAADAALYAAKTGRKEPRGTGWLALVAEPSAPTSVRFAPDGHTRRCHQGASRAEAQARSGRGGGRAPGGRGAGAGPPRRGAPARG